MDVDQDKFKDSGFEKIGSIADRVVRNVNPEGYAEWQLRQALSDAVQSIGRDKVIQVIKEEIAA